MAKARKKDTPTGLKVPPHNIEAEQAVLGGVLINNDALNQVMDLLSPGDFYREAHADLFEGMVSLYDISEPIDIITLSQVLNKKDRMEKVGGVDYLATLVQSVATSAGIVFHAEIVRNLSVRRRLISQCSTISELCFQEQEDTASLLERAEQSIFDIAEGQIREGFQSLKQVITGSFKKLERDRKSVV